MKGMLVTVGAVERERERERERDIFKPQFFVEQSDIHGYIFAK